jgi:hypothetical protein
MSRPLDPGHAERKQKLEVLAKRALFAGVGFLVVGATSFIASAGMGVEHMSLGSMLGFAGIFSFAAGWFATMFVALPLFLFAKLGSALRYQAEEVVPVVEDVARRGMDLHEELAPRAAKLEREVAPDVAAAAEEVAHGVARGARQGWDEGKR